MEFLIGLLVGVLLVGTINFFLSLIMNPEMISKTSRVYHYITIGLGWIWFIIIKPIWVLVYKFRKWYIINNKK